MEDMNEDTLLGQHLGGDPPREAFRERTLRDSTAALVRVQRRRVFGRRAALAAAAVLIGGIAFLGGRLSAPRALPEIAGAPLPAVASDGVTVPTELLEWLEAARMFRQLGMADRMALAVDRAGSLLSHGTTATSDVKGQPFLAVCDEQTDFAEAANPRQSCDILNRVMANSLGGYNHADEMD